MDNKDKIQEDIQAIEEKRASLKSEHPDIFKKASAQRTESIKNDLKKLMDKKEKFNSEYPRSYRDIGEKYGVSVQYLFQIRPKKNESSE